MGVGLPARLFYAARLAQRRRLMSVCREMTDELVGE
jgi:hypothetical protein